jgi:hypothetical protein
VTTLASCERNGSDHEVHGGCGAADPSADSKEVGVDDRAGRVERENATVEILLEHL